MSKPPMKILVVGAKGSIGSLVVEEAPRQVHSVRALVRSADKARRLPAKAQAIVSDLTRPNTLAAAVKDVDSIVFTHGSDGGSKLGSETVDYDGVCNVLTALGSRTPRIALMTAIGLTNRTGSYNRSTESHDWKRRAERLVRASACLYTIVRLGWFDYNKANEHQLVFLQGEPPRSTVGLLKPALTLHPSVCGVSIHLNQSPADSEESVVTSVRYQVLDIKAMNAFVTTYPQHKEQ